MEIYFPLLLKTKIKMDTQIIQFTAGRGPSECEWVVAKVVKIFLEEVVENKLDYTIITKQSGIQNGTIQSVTIQLQGKNSTNFIAKWNGTIQWVGKSTYRKYHKRKNWFIGCFLINHLNEISVKDSDIEYQATRSSGPGGQHVNKVSSAIRATHSPTNIQVLVMDSRSQHQNKKIAKQRLMEKLQEHNLQKISKSIENQWNNHLNLQRGNPIKVFHGSDFKQKPIKKKFKQTRTTEKQKWLKQTK